MTEVSKIMVIDDSEVVLAGVKATLVEAGYEVITSTQTVGNARHLKGCDLAIIDFHMPGIDGGEVMSALRSAFAATGTNCLFYLYTSDEKAADDYARFGFDGSFTKKGDAKALLPQVQAALRLARMRALAKRSR